MGGSNIYNNGTLAQTEYDQLWIILRFIPAPPNNICRRHAIFFYPAKFLEYSVEHAAGHNGVFAHQFVLPVGLRPNICNGLGRRANHQEGRESRRFRSLINFETKYR